MGARYDAFDKKCNDLKHRIYLLENALAKIEVGSTFLPGKHPAVIILLKSIEADKAKLARWLDT